MMITVYMMLLTRMHIIWSRFRPTGAAPLLSFIPPIHNTACVSRKKDNDFKSHNVRTQSLSLRHFHQQISAMHASKSNEDNGSYSENQQSMRPSWTSRNEEFRRKQGDYSSNDSSPHKNERERRNSRQPRKGNSVDGMADKFPSKNFREDFLGTRVFVQGIPDWIKWQELKDHFKIAGDVVFASVSMDPSTGMSKGCGVVQFESTAMAKNAIKIMRDHPIQGNTLYVREDYQEQRSGDNFELNNNVSGPRNTSRPPSIWRCGDEENSNILLSEEERKSVENVIRARDQARRRKNYETSDMLREDLKRKFSVHLDDRLKLWWPSVDNSVPSSISDMKGDGRWGNLKPWRQIPTTVENDACVSTDLVNGLLKQRDIARREKDFSTADMLLEQARTSPDGDLHLRIHDESRTWRIWTEAPPPKIHISPTPMSAAEQCIEIVSKHDPSKIPEVKMVLKKFPGREYNILKKLKQNYEQ
mmetsp:Transcript_10328/g.14604  ORF Transcript_10328/g.14604 Transcript_10328/m.14604 type:complete len:473 (+) Transcript_10328:108-1526(+)